MDISVIGVPESGPGGGHFDNRRSQSGASEVNVTAVIAAEAGVRNRNDRGDQCRSETSRKQVFAR